MNSQECEAIVQRALDRVLTAGAQAGDALLIENDSLEARVRGEEIDFVKQARERTLGIRALVRDGEGRPAISARIHSSRDRSVR